MSQLCPSGKEKELEIGEKGFCAIEVKKDADVGGSSKPISETNKFVDERGSAFPIRAAPMMM